MSKKINILLSAFVLLMVSSCNFLDESPITEPDIITPQAVSQMLVSAYPGASNAKMCEFYSDNYVENEGAYTIFNLCEDDFYHWDDTDQEGQDTPQYLWDDCYAAISASNKALELITELGGGSEYNPQRGEALITRAYSHFILATTFCKAYDSNASANLGIPYMTWLENTVSPQYDRGTLAQTYDNIRTDIENALPFIDDASYKVLKYHFNKKAAYAFAVRFYLLYMQNDMSNLDKVIEYAEKALGTDAYSSIRDWKALGALTPNGEVQPNAYISASNKANLMLQQTISWWPVVGDPGFTTCMKYSHNNQIAKETCNSIGPWGGFSAFYQQSFAGNSSTKYGFRRMYPYQKMVSNESGYHRMIAPVFTTDETLMCRAEAYALKHEYQRAVDDIQAWQNAFTSSNKQISVESINEFYGSINYWSVENMTLKKELNPDFSVSAGTQENLIHNILHVRRILNLGNGMRWLDVKRYGITVQRLNFYGNRISVTDEMRCGDSRQAIQIPLSVIAAGMQANPRN